MREQTTRRAVLKATGALGTIAALAVPVAILAKAEAAEHPDAKLLQLGGQFDREHAILAGLKAHEDEMDAIFESEVARRGIVPNPSTWKAYCALRKETGLAEAVDRSGDQFDRLDEITATIRSIPAATLAGLAVKVRATAYDCGFSFSFDLPTNEIDWPEQCLLGLLREVERMAKG